LAACGKDPGCDGALAIAPENRVKTSPAPGTGFPDGAARGGRGGVDHVKPPALNAGRGRPHPCRCRDDRRAQAELVEVA
jgi:hypothetical protein